jgi:hypothetical protein
MIQKTAAVPEINKDPIFVMVETDYCSVCDDMIEDVSHTSPQFQIDNAKIINFLSETISDPQYVKTWIKACLKSSNGSGAKISFKEQYCGTNKVNPIE